VSCPQFIKVVTPGPPGPAGPTGPAGVGAAWQQGDGVPGAGVGSDGDFYLDTLTGNIYGPKIAGAWGAVIFNIAEGQQGPAGPAGATGATGATGAAGADGRTVLNGTGVPGSGLGANGDFFIDTTGWVIYGPKAGGVWPGGASLVGPAGATGATGPVGPTGPTGPAVPLSDATPQAPGVAAAGTASSAARGDHVHPLPGVVTTSAAGLQPATGYGSIAYAAQVTLDFAALNGQMNSITLTDALGFLTTNLANGREVRLRLIPGASERALTFPVDWVFYSAKPANIPANKEMILSLAAYGETNATVRAIAVTQP
jgi:hypothetical protein